MKKFLVLLLAFGMIFSFAACGGDGTTSNTSSTASTTSKAGNSSTAEESDDKSTTTSTSTDISDDTTSGDTSSEVSNPTGVSFTNKYVSFGKEVSVDNTATQTTSIRLTKIDEAPVAGDVVLFTNAYGTTIAASTETYADYAILVCTYDAAVFGYTKTSLKTVGADTTKASTKIPKDGFVIAISKDQTTEIAHLSNIQTGNKFFPHGVQIGDVSVTLKKATKAPVIDGKISATEYGAAKWIVNENNKLWDYSQFEKDDYYATAEVYTTYDDTNLYIGVIVDSPYHTCPLTATTASGMWQYECIQVNVSTEDPLGTYIADHFDWRIDTKSTTDGVVRQYGFAASDTNESLSYIYMGIDTKFKGKVVCTRDDTKEMTYYEVAIPWSEFGTTAKPFKIADAGKIGYSISVNSSNDTAVWKNIKMRDGGGIILRNDFSKMSSTTLG